MAWQCKPNVTDGATRMPSSGVAHWVVEAPHAHPVWHSYAVVAIHLRSVEGIPEPIRYSDEATHELWVIALSPDECSRQDMINTGSLMQGCLHPLNFAAQFVELDDELARDRIERTVKEIVDGKLNPDTDYIEDWIHRFGGNMVGPPKAPSK